MGRGYPCARIGWRLDVREERREEGLQAVRVEQLEARGAAENGDAALETREQTATNERAPQQPARTRVPVPPTALRQLPKQTHSMYSSNIQVKSK